MSTEIHFVDIGQGNMVLIKADDGTRFVFDCNITSENQTRVLSYAAKVFGKGNSLKAFICSHRDADHIRGVAKLHAQNPIQKVWDTGYPGTSTDTPEYKEYMNLRGTVGHRVIDRKKREDFGRTRLRYMSDADERLPQNANAQGIVIKVEHRDHARDICLSSGMLPGDSDAETWRDGILKDYSKDDLHSSILMAAHHGSDSFFDIPSSTHWYLSHLRAISPAMVIVSVGPNTHGHPDKKALEFYEENTSGSDNGTKIARTDKKGTMKLVLKDEGGWLLSYNQS